MSERVFVHNVPSNGVLAANRARDFGLWSRAAVEDSESTWWNLWKRRLPGWELQEGDTILLLAAFRDARYLVWQMRARDVAHFETSGWEPATRAIAKWAKQPVSDIRMINYGNDKQASNAGLALGFRTTAVRRLDLPAPDALRVGRHGWLVTDSDALREMGIELKVGRRRTPTTTPPSTPVRRGQGRLDVASRLAVERRAMTVAKAWCKAQGWRRVVDTSHSLAWDLEASDSGGHRRYIEVKGQTGRLGQVEITAGELEAARRHGHTHAMVVVHSISLSTSPSGVIRAGGGTVEAYDPWAPSRSELVETRYRWVRQPDERESS